MIFSKLFKGEKKDKGSNENNVKSANNGAIARFSPTSFDDVETILDNLIKKEPTIISLAEVGAKTAQRVIDIISGATYAVGGNLAKLENDLYLFTPKK